MSVEYQWFQSIFQYDWLITRIEFYHNVVNIENHEFSILIYN